MPSRAPRPDGRKPIAAAATVAIASVVVCANETSNRSAAAMRNRRKACMRMKAHSIAKSSSAPADAGALVERAREHQRRRSRAGSIRSPAPRGRTPVCDQSCTTPPSTHGGAEPREADDRGEVQAARHAYTGLAQVGEAHHHRAGHREQVRGGAEHGDLQDLEHRRMVVREVRHQPELERVERDDDRHAHQPGDDDQLPANRLVDVGKGADCREP